MVPRREEVNQSLERAAEDGPAALFDALSRALAAHPDLAGDPASAVALARAASMPVRGLLGANLPVYRAVAQRISAAAPAQSRESIALAVADEVGRIAQGDPRAAQQAGPPGAAFAAPEQPTDTAPGIRIGSFILYPDIQTGVFYDSNIFATRRATRDDTIGVISPSATLESDWERHSLTIEGQVDVTRYARYSSEDTTDWRGSVEGRIDAGQTMQIYYGALALRDHEDRSSPDAVFGLEPTVFYEQRGYGGISERFGNVVVRVGGAVERLTFDDVPSIVGTIDNSDRDRNRYTFGVLVRHQGSRMFQPFVEVLGDNRHYDDEFDDFGYQRSSTGFRVGMGAQFEFAPEVSGEVFGGVMQQDYEDPRFSLVTTPAFNAYVRWDATSSTRLTAFIDRSIEETTLPDSPAYIYTVAGIRVEQGLSRTVSLIGRAAVARNDFQQVARMDDEVDLSIGLRYRVLRSVTLGADYRFTERDSNVENADFDRHQVYARLGLAF